jgi:hypothetical protein
MDNLQIATTFCNMGEMIAEVNRRKQKTNKVKRAFKIVKRAMFLFHRECICANCTPAAKAGILLALTAGLKACSTPWWLTVIVVQQGLNACSTP